VPKSSAAIVIKYGYIKCLSLAKKSSSRLDRTNRAGVFDKHELVFSYTPLWMFSVTVKQISVCHCFVGESWLHFFSFRILWLDFWCCGVNDDTISSSQNSLTKVQPTQVQPIFGLEGKRPKRWQGRSRSSIKKCLCCCFFSFSVFFFVNAKGGTCCVYAMCEIQKWVRNE